MSTAAASAAQTATREFKNHELDEDFARPGVRYEKRPAQTPDGKVVPGLYNAWIWLDNPGQFNSYTTDMVKGVILAFRAASNARDVNCVVFTGAGDKAFCTGGNTKEYAEYYAGHRRNTACTCACSMTWYRRSSPATSR